MINKKQKLNLFFWHQKTDRNLPPTLLQTMAHSSQKDESYRVTSEWQFSEVRKQFFIRAAYFDENITYADTVYGFSAYSRSQSLIAEAEAKAAVGSIHFLNAGVNNTFVRALSESAGLPDGYPHRPQRNHLALFASYKLVTLNKKYSLTISARQELLEKEFMPFTFSAGTDLKITKWLTAIASVARVYRVPTFNDLFWTPGGNPDLLAENGFSEDAGLSVFARSKKQNFSFTFEPTFFNRNIEAWIIWLPAGNYWTPQNIMKVWSRGVETNTVFTYQCKKTKFTLSALANYVISTNEQSKTANDASLGKQLIYVPIFTLRAKFSVEYKGYALVYRHGFTSARYTATDNSESLPAFDLASIRLSKEFNVKSWRLSVFADIENLFNKEYQAILIRPMPGRSYSGGIALQFNQPFSNHKTLQP